MTVPNPQFQNYDTDQFVDPYNGYTVHDDGSDTYTSPYTGITYFKQRSYNGTYTASGGSTYNSYKITLRPITDIDALLAENGNMLISEVNNNLLIREM